MKRLDALINAAIATASDAADANLLAALKVALKRWLSSLPDKEIEGAAARILAILTNSEDVPSECQGDDADTEGHYLNDDRDAEAFA